MTASGNCIRSGVTKGHIVEEDGLKQHSKEQGHRAVARAGKLDVPDSAAQGCKWLVLRRRPAILPGSAAPLHLGGGSH